MVSSGHKRGALEWDTVSVMLLLTATLIVLALVIVFLFSPFKGLEFREYSCYATNQFKGFIEVGKGLFPSPCRTTNPGLVDIEKEKIEEKFAGYMWKCWWMYGEGKIQSLGKEGFTGLFINNWKTDVDYTCYTFLLKEDLDVHSLARYVLMHDKNGNKLNMDKLSDSVYNKIENTDNAECSLCVDSNLDIIKKGTVIYLKFRDDTQGTNEDQLLLTTNREFEGDLFSGCGGKCFTVLELLEGR